LFERIERNIIFHRLYNKHHAAMLYTARQILGKERAEEAVHDVFVHLLEKFEKNFSELCDKPALFFVVSVRNHSINLLRKERLDMTSLETYDYVPDTRADVAFAEAEDAGGLVALIRALPPTSREILEYRYIMEYTNEEIAEILGISESAVSSRLSRAKAQLKAKLEEREVDSDD
jgi:RNA polymerase sigma-70 factor (ECF subfamily)